MDFVGFSELFLLRLQASQVGKTLFLVNRRVLSRQSTEVFLLLYFIHQTVDSPLVQKGGENDDEGIAR